MPAWAEANKPRIMEFHRLARPRFGERRFVAGDGFRSPTSPAPAVDFMKPAKLSVPDGLGNLKRWHADVSARPSASA